MKAFAKALVLLLVIIISPNLKAGKFPPNMHISDDGRQLIMSIQESDDFYQMNEIKTIELKFKEPNWYEILTSNYKSKTELEGTLIYDGIEYQGVGVRFRGQTSYSRLKNSQKKSFNISLDYADENQRIDNFKTLNLLNCFEDASYIKEALFNRLIGKTIPTPKSNFVRLVINNVNWGLYFNIQQLNKSFYSDWFTSGDGTNWRAEFPDTSSAKPTEGQRQNPFGTGLCTMNYLGAEPIIYQKYYTLKSTERENPWEDLMKVFEQLNSTNISDIYNNLKNYLDIDMVLWFLANESVFGDDDGYINKGGMDYYIYHDIETGRMTPIQYDGNSTFLPNKINETIFRREQDNRFPLIYKLLVNNQIKQRYVAHVRTIANKYMSGNYSHPLTDGLRNYIEQEVLNDPKKIYTNENFYSGVNAIKNFLTSRYNFILSNQMVKAEAPLIQSVDYHTDFGINSAPTVNESVIVTAKVTHSAEISKVFLYYGTGIQGTFNYIEMTDNGEGKDEAANDNIYTAELPGFSAGTYVRFYVEAIADNMYKTASYNPEQAEHNVYFYQVKAEIAENSDVVINEFMASNSKTIADPQGEYDDWIELYNKGNRDVNLSGMYLSDKVDNITKWQFPNGTIIKAGEYLIIWADDNGKANTGLHANFKLSKDGEVVILTDTDANGNRILDSLHFGPQITDVSYGRLPNAVGPWDFLEPTPLSVNLRIATSADDSESLDARLSAYPNPFTDRITIELNTETESYMHLMVIDIYGRTVKDFGFMNFKKGLNRVNWFPLTQGADHISSGTYFVKLIGVDNSYIIPVMYIVK